MTSFLELTMALLLIALALLVHARVNRAELRFLESWRFSTKDRATHLNFLQLDCHPVHTPHGDLLLRCPANFTLLAE